jgi:hypothetical protein
MPARRACGRLAAIIQDCRAGLPPIPPTIPGERYNRV